MTAAVLSGVCRHANAIARRGVPEGDPRLEQWHAACKGRFHSRPGQPVVECRCLCHAVAGRDIHAEIREAKRQRLIAAGLDPDATTPRRHKDRGFCKHDHEMTPENTGPRGECRACKREASARCKARQREGAGDA